jgi:hypothetical protein
VAADARVVTGELARLRRLTNRLLLLASAGTPGFLQVAPVATDHLVLDALERWGDVPPDSSGRTHPVPGCSTARPKVVQQAGHGPRVVEGGVGGGPLRGTEVRGQAGRGMTEVESGVDVVGCGAVLVQLGGVSVQAAVVGGVAERGLVAGRGGGPELRRGDLAGAVRPAVLVQVVRE